MDILTKDEFHLKFEDLRLDMEDGCLFIHPTDTIYGIGCDATVKEAVKRIRDLKNRGESPFSIIAPGKDWIMKNCIIPSGAEKWIDKLPGPYTLIFELKKKECIAANVNFDLETLGVRMPNHWISEFVKKYDKPIVTTSANKSGENFMTCLENLDNDIKSNVDFIIYEDEKHGRPSKIIDLSVEGAVVHRR